MDFPFGHHHHHNNRRDDDEYPPPQYPPPPPHSGAYPPPPTYGGAYPHPPSHNRDYPYAPPQNYPPPPPNVGGVHHVSHNPHMESPNYGPPPPPPHVPGVQHISHNTPHMDSPNYAPPPPPQPYEHQESGGGSHSHHHFKPHMPGFMAGHFHHSPSHESSGEYGGEVNMYELEGYFGNKKSHRIYCKAGGNTYCVGIRDKKVVLTYADPNDPTQHWYKDEKFSTKVKDEDGYPSFSLVNKATGQAMKHPVSGQPVDLVPFKPDHLDASILWTESKDLGSGYRTIRNVNNVKMVLDAFNGDKDHGGVHDGTFLSIFKCWKGDNQNQQWKIFPY